VAEWGLTLLKEKKEESQLAKITKDSSKTTIEQVHGLITQVMKDFLFNLSGNASQDVQMST